MSKEPHERIWLDHRALYNVAPMNESDKGHYYYRADVVDRLRQEARAAALKEAFAILCSECREGDEPAFDEQSKWYYHTLADNEAEVGCAASKLRIEAATKQPDEVKEGNDG